MRHLLREKIRLVLGVSQAQMSFAIRHRIQKMFFHSSLNRHQRPFGLSQSTLQVGNFGLSLPASSSPSCAKAWYVLY